MKLSKVTIDLLKNFSNINTSICIEPGKTITTMAVTKNIIGVCDVAEDFPQTVCIYDLGQFLSTLSLFDEPELEFEANNEKYFGIKGKGNSKVRFFMTNPSFVTSGKRLKTPDPEVEIELSAQLLERITKAVSVLNLPEMIIQSDGEEVCLVLKDTKNDSANTFSYNLGKGDGTEYSFVFKTQNLKLASGRDYKVKISKKKISEFSSGELTYWIALEPSSEYKG